MTDHTIRIETLTDPNHYTLAHINRTLTLAREKPCKQLHIEGNSRAMGLLEKLPGRGFAVVGTRHPMPRSLQQIRKWIGALSGRDLVIISGFARGVDTAAHVAALDAKLPTIAITASGLDSVYPPENENLKHRILENDGLFITERDFGPPIFASEFLDRNRLIAALASAVWVVEAPHRSGALNTANWCEKFERKIYATPSFPGDPAFAGNERLLNEGKTLPFYSPTALSQSWMEFAGWTETKHHRKQLTTDERRLTQVVAALTSQRGGAAVQELLDWALAENWLPQRFFDTLQAIVKKRAVLDENGLLLKNPN